jgi:hypothetical protein
MHTAKNRREFYDRQRALAPKVFVNPRVCAGCGETKEQEEFASYLRGEHRYWHTRCNPCRHQAYKHSETCARKKALILKLRAGKCKDCGQKHPNYVNHFVIQRGAPLFHVEHAWTGRSEAAIREEVKKYAVVCSNCYSTRLHNARPERWLQPSRLAELPPELQEVAGLSLPIEDAKSDTNDSTLNDIAQ